MESAGRSDTGCVRKNNEDTFRRRDELGLYLVADGMGGAQAGEQASNLAADAVVDFLERRTDKPDGRLLEEALWHANRVVVDAASADARLEGMGTTMVAALVARDSLWIASVGDSRAYLLPDLGLPYPLTEDQSWVNEIGRMQLGLGEDVLLKHPMRHVLTMAVGVGEPLRVNSYCYPLPARGVMIMLCSDGLYGVVDEKRMEAALRAEASLEERCQRLIEMARASGGPDNITVVLLQPAVR
jgi:PPM family protein phosphatase